MQSKNFKSIIENWRQFKKTITEQTQGRKPQQKIDLKNAFLAFYNNRLAADQQSTSDKEDKLEDKLKTLLREPEKKWHDTWVGEWAWDDMIPGEDAWNEYRRDIGVKRLP